MEFRVYAARWNRLKAGLRTLALALFLIPGTCHLAHSQTNGTPFYAQFFNADGSPQTNIITMQVWPPDDNAFTVDGTNIIFGDRIYTNTPNASGFWTNRLFANTYVVKIPSAGRSFFVKLLDTQTYLPLAYYATNIANVNNPQNMFSVVTGWLGYVPATNTSAMVIASLGYTPLTNTFAAITNAMHYAPLPNSFAAITNALSYFPLTNSFASITNALSYTPATNSFSGIVAAEGYTALTNSFTALTNAIGYTPATNSFAGIVAAEGYLAATNSFNSITNLLITSGGVPAILGYQPATNSSSGIFSALGYIPANITNAPGLFTAGNELTIITNGNTLYVSTNLATGVLPTLAAPNGSILVSTNGSLYVRTNSIWVLK